MLLSITLQRKNNCKNELFEIGAVRHLFLFSYVDLIEFAAVNTEKKPKKWKALLRNNLQ